MYYLCFAIILNFHKTDVVLICLFVVIICYNHFVIIISFYMTDMILWLILGKTLSYITYCLSASLLKMNYLPYIINSILLFAILDEKHYVFLVL